MANNVVNQSTTTNFITVTFRDKNPSSTEVNLTSPDQIEVRSLIGPTGAAGITQDTGSLLLTASYSNPNLTFTKGDGTTFSAVISTDTPTLAQVTAQGSSTTTAITASIISASGALTASNLSGNNTGDQDLSLFVQNSQTSSFVQNSQTSSFVQNSQTGSFAVTGSNVIFENITGSNISASGTIEGLILGGTLNTAIQTGITQVGNLTTLTVDNLNLNSNTLSSTSDVNVFLNLGASGIGFQATDGDNFSFNTNQNNVDLLFAGTSDQSLFYIDSSEDKIGIGTNTPGEKLEVIGNISASGALTASNLSGTNTGDQNISNLAITGSNVLFNNITASGNISASGNLLGGGLNINGPSNSHVEVGEYNVGFDVLSNPAFNTEITGSGLIVSGNMADQNHHNMIKIGDIELVDVNTFVTENQFLIHNAKSFKISSGSDGGDITTQNRLMEHDGTTFKLYSENTQKLAIGSLTTTFDNTNVEFKADAFFRAPIALPTSNGHFLYTVSSPSVAAIQTKAVQVGDMFKVLTGAVTASAVSASGTSSFAQMSLPDLPTSDPGIAGRLFTTQSTGTGGNLDGQLVLLVSQG
jgi:hypothetical protein